MTQATLIALPSAAKKWQRSVIRVGDGRGFVLAHGHHRYVATAAHCLPFLPPAHGASYATERTAFDLLGPLGEKPTVAAEIVFIDPIADIALLGTPDHPELNEMAEAYEALTEATPLPLTTLAFERSEHRLPNGKIFFGQPEATADGWLLSLDGDWFRCRLSVQRAVWIADAASPIVGGMSGSPIITRDGAVGVCCLASGIVEDGRSLDSFREGGPNPYLPFALPGWMAYGTPASAAA